ncbi:MAG: ATP-dependent zinc metalloprotease FtsH [Gemmatimonadetes bacterium]|uniref:ATP-dependent zinc metalloprotease FtsH n=1 Tax=Candidatus Kutchimonas denitrificans TaxID=3056748 RepID=A0AAE5CCB4_9BACT|nr:ATP-dependent zinc metalloprotease FtsH [Gemmatimonadota bacterium]NIR75648.1 ATP-dependent zinc metalloprotease FtsH [Candidatus Kutchimonas denitrificans]NIR99627.1 ATP-dependent zinc metalloprotease FtsH [Gemmatimonadota bacterium]NIT65902.1 ATP-dependent zinc metalloprotease FtsH [Gemmatimonadota bacterium]NIV22071.1 ATP-dependent zinc metalloprotease FtsH [Gemmatimonadota bacterium]
MGQNKPPMLGRVLIWLLVGILIAYALQGVFGVGQQDVTQISYTTFREHVTAGSVRRVTVKGEQIRGELKTEAMRVGAENDTTRYKSFITYLPSFGDDELMSALRAQGVEIETRPADDSSWWPMLLTAILPLLLIVGLGYLFITRMSSQGRNIMGVGKSKAKLYDRSQEETTFDEVAGAEGAKQELREVVEFLKEPARFEAVGGAVPKGVLLVGPPGTGKTLLARAVAGEAEVPFFSITGSDFMEMFVGVGASRVRDLFKQAKESAPAIIFIDELDSIGRHRGAGLGGGHDEREQTLNQLLSELDGFEPTQNVIVMAATNRPDILDPALLRPGRFDRRIAVNLPTARQRAAILRIHAKDKPLAKDVDLERLAKATPGLSGADLANLLNEAALNAARNDREAIENADIEEARDRILMGRERTGLVLTDEEIDLLAYHEAGHAVVAAALPHADPIHKVTIVPRGRAMGVTQQLPEKERYIYEREYMLDRLAVMMGGRAAEQLVFDTSTSGAENDLKQATQLARRMVLDWGMSEKLGPMAAGGERRQVFLGEEIAHQKNYSEATARQVDEEVKAIVDGAYARAKETIETHRDILDQVAELLKEREEIDGAEVTELLDSAGD